MNQIKYILIISKVSIDVLELLCITWMCLLVLFELAQPFLVLLNFSL